MGNFYYCRMTRCVAPVDRKRSFSIGESNNRKNNYHTLIGRPYFLWVAVGVSYDRQCSRPSHSKLKKYHAHTKTRSRCHAQIEEERKCLIHFFHHQLLGVQRTNITQNSKKERIGVAKDEALFVSSLGQSCGRVLCRVVDHASMAVARFTRRKGQPQRGSSAPC